MTPDTLSDLMDLYMDDELPESLRAHVELFLAAHPDAAQDVVRLKAAIHQLKAAAAERPDDWFIDRLLGTLLREHAAEDPQTIIARG